MGQLEPESRPRDDPDLELSICSGRRLRNRRTRQLRHMDGRRAVWARVEADRGGWRRLGTVSPRPLGVGRLVWVDVGQLRPVGLGTVSLWPLVLGHGFRLVLVSGRIGPPSLLVA